MSKRRNPAPIEKHEQWGKTLYDIREMLVDDETFPGLHNHYGKDSSVRRSMNRLVEVIDSMSVDLLEDLYTHHSRRQHEYDDDDYFFHIYYRAYHKAHE